MTDDISPVDAPLERPEVVVLEKVSKKFVVRRDNSLKERLVTFGRLGRRHREEFWALDGVDLSIQAGSTIGLIGHNGSGKSTLLKVIGGILDPTSGVVRNRGRIAALLELGAGFHPDLTGRENVYLNASILGLSRAETDAQLDGILAFAGIGDFIDTQVKFYSSGMYVRLAFAVAVHTDPDVLLVDEVLAVGDEAFQRKCLDKIRAFQQEGRTIILVTHSLSQVVELCDRAVLLNRGTIVFDGEPRDAVTQFRNILEERRLAETGTAASETSSFCQITATSMRSTNPKAEPGTILPGDDLLIDLSIYSERPLSDLVVAVLLNNPSGQVVYGTTTRLLEIRLPEEVGTREVQFTIAQANLGPGKYFLNVSLMDYSGTHLYDWLQAASIDVPDHVLSFGSLYALPQFAVKDS